MVEHASQPNGDNCRVSQQQKAAVERAIDAIGRRDVAAIVEQVDESVEIHPLVSVWQATYHGHSGVEQWARDVTELWDEFSVSMLSARELDRQTLLVSVEWRGLARGTSTEMSGPGAALVRFRADKVVAAEFHFDEQRAVEANEAKS